MSFFADGLKAQEEMRIAFMSDPAWYLRGEMRLKIAVTPGDALFRTTDRNGVSTVVRTLDFIVAASELSPVGIPKRGDFILFNGGRYEVVNPDGGPCWKWSDMANRVYRIHTKYAGKEDTGND